MKEKIKQMIASLLMERAHIKQILKYFSDRLSEEEVDAYLDRLGKINELIDILEKELK
ncbi:hypothetical protein [Emticicia agri]|uniref:hypothetical protein n=1 Tax=Emticicia agri TaxID=2492393 RepID=UPI0013EA6A4D|nr:hypothetical protein [Emticicia agri]